MFDEAKNLISKATSIVVIQADNPDGDSLASALALEELLASLGKEVFLYCGIDMPDNVKYMPGWDRVSKDLPNSFDLSIFVDCSFISLLDQLQKTKQISRVRGKKSLIVDHHASEQTIDFATVSLLNENAVSTGEIIFDLAQHAGWTIDARSGWYIAASILSDSLGLTTKKLDNYPKPFEIMATLVKLGVSVSDLQEKRYEQLRYSIDIMRYKGRLLERVEFFDENKIATVTIPYNEIKQYSQDFNPTVVLDELRMVEGVKVMVGFKLYDFNGRLGRVTARIRCSRDCMIAAELAEHFSGGGHPFAAGFRVEEDGIDFAKLKADVIRKASELLEKEAGND